MEISNTCAASGQSASMCPLGVIELDDRYHTAFSQINRALKQSSVMGRVL